MTLIINILILCVLIPLAFWVLNWCLRGLDERAGFNWMKIRYMLHENPIAASVYFGARFVGVCLLLAALLGRYLF